MGFVELFTGGNDGLSSAAAQKAPVAMAGGESVADTPLIFSVGATGSATASVSPTCAVLSGPDNLGSSTFRSYAWVEAGGLTSGDISGGQFQVTWNTGLRGIDAGLLFRGVTDTGALVNGAGFGAVTAVTTPTIASVPAGSSVIIAVVSRANATTPPTIGAMPAGYTSLTQRSTAYPASPNYCIRFGYQDGVSAGTYGGNNISISGSTPLVTEVYLIVLPPSGSAASATGVLALAGSAGASGVAVAAGTIALAGAAGGVAGSVAAGVVALAGTGGAGATGGATGALVLSGAAAGQAVTAATGSITLTGTAAGRATGAASGALALSGSGSGSAVIAAAGTILLGGIAQMDTTAGGALTLTGTAGARAAVTAAGSISMTGGAPGQDSAGATGSLALAGAAAGRAAGAATAAIALAGTAGAGSTASAVAILTLTAAAIGRAVAAATGTLQLTGTATASGPGGNIPFDGKTGHPRTAWTAGRPKVYPNPRSARVDWTSSRVSLRSGPHAP